MADSLLKKYLTRPAPANPVRDVVQMSVIGFVLGALMIPFSTLLGIPSSSPRAYFLPLMVAGFATLSGFLSTGVLLLGPVGRKRALWAVLFAFLGLLATAFQLMRTVHHLLDMRTRMEVMEEQIHSTWVLLRWVVFSLFAIGAVGWVKRWRSQGAGETSDVQ